jgi:hypothetical protein
LDDEVAVRTAMNLTRSVNIPSVRKVTSPKETLESLLRCSDRAEELPRIVWPDVAVQLEISRCQRASYTGFEKFVCDVREEIGSLLKSR